MVSISRFSWFARRVRPTEAGKPVWPGRQAHRPRRVSPTAWVLAALLLTLACWLLLTRLAAEPLAMWDEARLAVNALEMHETGDPIVTRFQGAPDLWNTKPPFVIWIQAALLGFVDPPELAIRLPAAVATVATVLLVFGFLLREVGDPWPGFLAGLVLLGTPAFIGYHAGRSGDYDAILVFWATLYCCAWYAYCARRHGRALAVFAFGLSFAILTKGIAGLLMTPGLLAFTAMDGQVGKVLRDWRAWTAAGTAILVGLGWYAIREHAAPGYIAAVLANEVGSFSNATDGTRADAFYLLDGMAERRFTPWIYLVPPAWLLAWYAQRRLAAWATCLLVGFFAVVEHSSTKLAWYDLPAYPIAAIVLGVSIALALRHSLASLAPGRAWLLPTAIVAGCTLPVADTETSIMTIDWHADSRLDYGEALDGLRAGKVTILDGGVSNSARLPNYNASLVFQVDRARERGVHVQIIHPGDALSPGERFLTCDPDALASVGMRFALGAEAKDGVCTIASISKRAISAGPPRPGRHG